MPPSSPSQDGTYAAGGDGSDDGGGGDGGDDGDGGGQRNSSSFSFLEFCSAPDLRAAQFLLTSGDHCTCEEVAERPGVLRCKGKVDTREIGRAARGTTV